MKLRPHQTGISKERGKAHLNACESIQYPCYHPMGNWQHGSTSPTWLQMSAMTVNGVFYFSLLLGFPRRLVVARKPIVRLTARNEPLGPKISWKCFECAMSAEKLTENVTTFTVPCSNSYRFHEPWGYAPSVICNDCYSWSEGVGFKGRSIHQGSCTVSVSVGSFAKLLVQQSSKATTRAWHFCCLTSRQWWWKSAY